VRVEALEGYAGVVLNSMVLTGAAHYPPLFNALPCVAPVQAGGNDTFPHDECAYTPLLTAGNLRVVMTIHEAAQGEVVRRLTLPAPLTWPQLSRMTSADAKRTALLSYLFSCPELAALIGATAVDTDEDDQHRHTRSPCSLSTAAELVSALVAPVTHRYWVDGLETGSAYTFAVQYTNDTHITAPFHSQVVPIQPQVRLYEKEQRTVTRYFNHLAEARATAQRKVARGVEADALREVMEQPTPSTSDVKAATPSPSRSIAPFETALNVEGGLCPASFHQLINEYRSWHAAQVKRLMAVMDDPRGLRALLTADPVPIRIIVSQVNQRSGVSDRTHGLLGVYLTAMLTKRVLLMADDWPDIFLSMQPSLQLNSALIAPHLNHSLLLDLSRDIPLSLDGLPIDDLDTHYPTPITWLRSIRGMQLKFLLESKQHSLTLKQWGLTPHTIVGCVYHSFWTVRLSTLISHSGYAVPFATLLHRDTVGVGIQIRTWDDGAFDVTSDQNGQPHKLTNQVVDNSTAAILSKEGLQGYFHCAHDVSDAVKERGKQAGKEVKPVWLLMADDVNVRRAAIRKWGGEGLVTLQVDELLGHSSLGDPSLQLLYQQHALVDQYLFSLCQHHVISRYSGFGRLPAVLGMRGRAVYGMDYREEYRRTMVCMSEEKHGMSIEQLAQDNSWL